jgi:hypothetical protein
MTSTLQIEANRRNAARSTGPITEAGKQRSRQNAIRHGLCAETVVGVLEDVQDYKGFEAAIIADFSAETAVERELVLRLASLLWRIRRATAIETELFRMQAEILQEGRLDRARTYLTFGSKFPKRKSIEDPSEGCDPSDGDETAQSRGHPPALTPDPGRDLAHCFQRLINLSGESFVQLGRHERALSHQIGQILLLLRQETRRRRASNLQKHYSQRRDLSAQDQW